MEKICDGRVLPLIGPTQVACEQFVLIILWTSWLLVGLWALDKCGCMVYGIEHRQLIPILVSKRGPLGCCGNLLRMLGIMLMNVMNIMFQSDKIAITCLKTKSEDFEQLTWFEVVVIKRGRLLRSPQRLVEDSSSTLIRTSNLITLYR